MIARSLLRYSCIYTGLDKEIENNYDAFKFKSPIELKRVYITNDIQHIYQQYNTFPSGEMILMYDKTYSQPSNLQFSEDERIAFEGVTYQIQTIHVAPFGNHVELTLERING